MLLISILICARLFRKSNLGERRAMYVCICKNVTDRQIRKAVYERDVSNVRELRACLGACDQCGKCARDARDLIREAAMEKRMLERHAVMAA